MLLPVCTILSREQRITDYIDLQIFVIIYSFSTCMFLLCLYNSNLIFLKTSQPKTNYKCKYVGI